MKRPICRGVFAIILLVVSSAVHIGERSAAADVALEAKDGLQVLITTSELVVGQNRFAFGLLKANKLLEGADVALRLYAIEGSEAQLAAELNAPYQAVGKIRQQRSVHRHSDGTEHVHGGESGIHGLYVAQVSFARAGTWGMEILANHEKADSRDVARTTVNVLDASHTPAIGSPAPRSRNLIVSDVKDLREIDTSPRPDPRLHRVRIVDAIEQRKPQLIVFATPQFCTSRMCGPVVDIVRTFLPAYGKRVAFTHQEIWQDFAEKKVFPTVAEWRLITEPWIFVVDGQGTIRAKFEGLVTAHELEAALQRALREVPTISSRMGLNDHEATVSKP
jgi:hypothetical protein